MACPSCTLYLIAKAENLKQKLSFARKKILLVVFCNCIRLYSGCIQRRALQSCKPWKGWRKVPWVLIVLTTLRTKLFSCSAHFYIWYTREYNAEYSCSHKWGSESFMMFVSLIGNDSIILLSIIKCYSSLLWLSFVGIQI